MGHTKRNAPAKRKLKRPKTILRLLDLEHSKSGVINSLGAVTSQDSYGHAIDEFTTWYSSEPRLSFSRAVVLIGYILSKDTSPPRLLTFGLQRSRHIGTEHLLLGILREEKCVAAEILHGRGLQLNVIREELIHNAMPPSPRSMFNDPPPFSFFVQ
jgi:hypothetical protein